MPHAVEVRLSGLLAAFEGSGSGGGGGGGGGASGGMNSTPMVKEGNESGSSSMSFGGFQRVDGGEFSWIRDRYIWYA